MKFGFDSVTFKFLNKTLLMKAIESIPKVKIHYLKAITVDIQKYNISIKKVFNLKVKVFRKTRPLE